MTCTFLTRKQTTVASFRAPRPALGLVALLIWCSAVAFAQNVSPSTNPPLSIRATHVLGFESAANNANGTLSFRDNTLQFQQAGKAPVEIGVASIQDAFLGGQSKQIGGLPMTLGKAAVPYGGGRVVSLFAHKKYDTLTLQYLDRNGGIHGAILQLRQGQGQILKNELVARGARVIDTEPEPLSLTSSGVTK